MPRVSRWGIRHNESAESARSYTKKKFRNPGIITVYRANRKYQDFVSFFTCEMWIYFTELSPGLILRLECMKIIELSNPFSKSRLSLSRRHVWAFRKRTLRVTHSCDRQYASILGEDITNGPAVDPLSWRFSRAIAKPIVSGVTVLMTDSRVAWRVNRDAHPLALLSLATHPRTHTGVGYVHRTALRRVRDSSAPGEVGHIKTVALCHPSCTTNGRTCSTVAGNHKPYGSHRVRPRCGPRSPPGRVPSISLHLIHVPLARSRDKCISFLLCLSLSLSISRSTFMRCAFHMALCWLLPFSRLLSVSPLYLSLSLHCS